MEEKPEIPKPIKTPTWKVSDQVRDHSNDPYILKKVEESREDIRKYGFPQEALDFMNSRKKGK